MRQLDRSAPGADIARAVSVCRFDCWAADCDTSQLQTVLYGPVHEAVLRYAWLHIPRPGRILDVGCGTGRLPARIVSAYQEAQVVGVDASPEMIKNAVAAPDIHPLRYICAVAERLPFADAVFDVVVVTRVPRHRQAVIELPLIYVSQPAAVAALIKRAASAVAARQ